MFRVVGLGMLASSTLLGLAIGAINAEAATAPSSSFDPVKANVTCVATTDKVSDEELSVFFANPKQILTDNPGGGLSLSNKVRSLAASSSKAYASILELAKGASGPQKAAIGAGLARAVGLCKDSQPDFAERMMGDVVGVSDSDLFAGYTGANTNTNVASVNSGATSSALGGGTTGADSSQRNAANNRQTASSDSATNSASAFDAGGDTGLVSDTTNSTSPSGI